MAEKPYALTGRDAERLREMYAAYKNRTPPTRPRDTRADDEEWLGPECYVALTPSAGTGTGTSSGSGTGTASGGIPARVGLTPGAATCDVFRLVGDDLYGPLFTEDVRNLSTAAVAADSWAIIQRDKSGTWWVSWTDVTAVVDQTTSDLGCRYEIRTSKACLSTSVTDTVGTGTGTGTGLLGGGSTDDCDGYRQPVGAFTDSGAGGAAWTGCTGGGTRCDDVLDCADSSYAGVVLNALTVSNPLITYYDFAVLSTIPPAAQVGGILVDVSCLFDFGNGHSPEQTWTLTAQLVLGGVAVGTPKSVDLLPAVTGLVLGGTSDKWGRVWTQAEVKDPTFGVALVLTVPSVDPQGKLLVNCTTLAVCWPTGSGGGGDVLIIPPAVIGGASTTVSLVQTYELIDRQAPCGTPKVKARWCLRDQGGCCSFSADGDDGRDGDYSDSALCAQAALPRVPKKLLLVFGPNTLPLADAADPGGVLGTGVRYRNDGFTIPLTNPCTDPTSATSCDGLMQYHLDSTCVIGANPLPGDPPNVGSQCAFWGEAGPPFQLPVRDSQSKLFGVYYGTRGYSTGAALTRDWVVCFSRLDGCNVAGLGPFQLSLTSTGTVGRGWTATNCDAGYQTTDPGGAGPDGVYSLFNALMQSRLISDDGSPAAPPPGGPVYADWRDVTLGDGLGLGRIYTIDYILIIDGDL